MTLQLSLRSGSPGVSRSRAFRGPLARAGRFLFVLDGMLITAVSAAAQTAPQQQYVYASVPVAGIPASEIAGFSKNATGGLSSMVLL